MHRMVVIFSWSFHSFAHSMYPLSSGARPTGCAKRAKVRASLSPARFQAKVRGCTAPAFCRSRDRRSLETLHLCRNLAQVPTTRFPPTRLLQSDFARSLATFCDIRGRNCRVPSTSCTSHAVFAPPRPVSLSASTRTVRLSASLTRTLNLFRKKLFRKKTVPKKRWTR